MAIVRRIAALILVALEAVSPVFAQEASVERASVAALPDATAPVGAPTAPDFIYRIDRPDKLDGPVLILLHGSGGDENSLVGLARQAVPGATLVAVRGRVVQDGRNRWYRKLSPVKFDQDDIRREADAFAGFISRISEDQALDLRDAIFVAYSNGANLIGALSLLRPGLVRKAVLLRPMPVLDEPPKASLAAASYLVVAGRDDRIYGGFAPALEQLLEASGADVDARVANAGHLLGIEDGLILKEWLSSDQAKPAHGEAAMR